MIIDLKIIDLRLKIKKDDDSKRENGDGCKRCLLLGGDVYSSSLVCKCLLRCDVSYLGGWV